MYSMRPWPNGCSGSGFWLDRRKPISVMMDEPASDRLLKASANMEIAPDKSPAVSFPAKRQRLSTIPTMPESWPYCSRTFGLPVS